jgi:sensor histidine kinase YesM
MLLEDASIFFKTKKGRWLLLFIILTMIGIVSTVQSSIVMIQRKQYEIAYSSNLIFNLLYWWFWLLVIPAINWLNKRFDFKKGNLIYSISVHLIVMVVIVLTHQLYTSAWCNYIFGEVLYLPLFDKLIWRILNLEWIFVDFIFYFLAVASYIAFEYQRNSNEKEKLILQLETRLAQAQLQALRMQLHPHFLFNTMNSISTLILKSEIQKANSMLVSFSEFLRITLEENGSQVVPLEKELLFIESYFDVEKIRFQDKLNVEMNINPSTRKIKVPNLILQPLIENAIKYAVAPKKSNGLVSITTKIIDDKLLILIKDNGPGINDDFPIDYKGKGIGIKNTKERLNKLYGNKASINFENIKDGGLLITLKIPFLKNHNSIEDKLVFEKEIAAAYQS